ncbi:zinc-binding metallopeptidase family protein [Blattabacterium cuenoti]|uniref:M42 family peptidase n=1 Tax=Blattabacterium cuenoti TaxID=1653831 RepID=UPI00163C7615|nr:M42 family peptidase [Blattabacterium cuenoti]
MLKNDSIEFLKNYLNSFSPTGDECIGQKIWMNYIKSYVEKVYIDLYGTAVGIINPNYSKKLIIEAHVDEISWYVNYIDDDGLIYVTRNGGMDHQITPSKKVLIHTKNGKTVCGVFGWPAIHTRKSYKEIFPQIKNIFIDVGASNKKEVQDLGIYVGCMISYPNQFFFMNKKFIVSKALDNKIGGFIIAEAIKMIIKNNIDLKYGLYIVNSVQEEIGLKGAKMISNNIKPDIAIITDVTHDTSTPMIEKKVMGDIKCGLGPVITYAPSIQKKIRDLLINTAINNKIKFQRLVSSYGTGTDTDAFAYSNQGVSCALVSIPLKYMHTSLEVVNKYDVEKSIILIFETLNNINNDYKKFFY